MTPTDVQRRKRLQSLIEQSSARELELILVFANGLFEKEKVANPERLTTKGV